MRRLALAFGLILTLAACGGDSQSSSGGDAGTARSNLRNGGGSGADAAGKDAAKPAGKNTLTDSVALGRATIRTGTMGVQVDDVTLAARTAVRTAETKGGYLESERTDTETTTVTLRVPPADFTATADAVSKLGTVTARTVETEDVTSDVADVEGRLKAARASTERVRALLQRARTISEITSLESELNEREAALESLETRRRALAGQTTYASLTVTFAKPAAAVAAGKAPSVENAGFGTGLRGGWRVFVTSLTVLLMMLGALLPFLAAALMVGLPIYLIRRRATARA